MVREIKFRAQRVDKGWVAGSLSYDKAGCAVIDGWNIVFGSLGQYVGRKDKDGAAIYEGDIVRTKSGYEGVVEYNTTYMRYEVRRPDDYDVIRHEDGIPEKDWEVLDNIHDNPHYFDGKTESVEKVDSAKKISQRHVGSHIRQEFEGFGSTGK